MASSSTIDLNRVTFRTQVLARHLHGPDNISHPPSLRTSECLQFSPAELSNRIKFDPRVMRKLMDGHNLEDRDWIYGLMIRSEVFGRQERGGKVYVGQDYDEAMEVHREKTMKRLVYLVDQGVLEGILTRKGPETEQRKFAMSEACGAFDQSLAVKYVVQYLLW